MTLLFSTSSNGSPSLWSACVRFIHDTTTSTASRVRAVFISKVANEEQYAKGSTSVFTKRNVIAVTGASAFILSILAVMLKSQEDGKADQSPAIRDAIDTAVNAILESGVVATAGRRLLSLTALTAVFVEEIPGMVMYDAWPLLNATNGGPLALDLQGTPAPGMTLTYYPMQPAPNPLSLPGGSLQTVKFCSSADGAPRLVTTSGSTICVVAAENPSQLTLLNFIQTQGNILFSTLVDTQFVATTANTMIVVDLTDALSVQGGTPEPTGSLTFSGELLYGQATYANHGYTIATSGFPPTLSSSIRIVDLSDPSALVEVGSVPLGTPSLGGIAIDGNTMAVGGLDSGMPAGAQGTIQLFDIDPMDPTSVTETFSIPGLDSVNYVHLNNNHLFVATDDGLRLYDISGGSADLLDHYGIGLEITSFEVEGTMLYANVGGHVQHVVDIRDPRNSLFVTSMAVSATAQAVGNGHIYTGGSAGYLQVAPQGDRFAFEGTPEGGAEGSYSVTVQGRQVGAVNGTVAEVDFDFTVDSVIEATPFPNTLYVATGSAWQLVVANQFSHLLGHTVSYSLINPPAGASINSASGVIDHTGVQSPSTINLRVRASDIDGAEEDLDIVVHAVQAPEIDPATGDLLSLAYARVDTEFSRDLSAAFVAPSGATLDFVIHGLPAWLRYEDGQLIGTPSQNDLGRANLEIEATDLATGLVLRIPFPVDVVAQLSPRRGTPVGTQTVNMNGHASVDLSAHLFSDPYGDVTLEAAYALSLELSDGTPAPDWMQLIKDDNGNLSLELNPPWKLANLQSEEVVEVNLVATTPEGLRAVSTFSIIILPGAWRTAVAVTKGMFWAGATITTCALLYSTRRARAWNCCCKSKYTRLDQDVVREGQDRATLLARTVLQGEREDKYFFQTAERDDEVVIYLDEVLTSDELEALGQMEVLSADGKRVLEGSRYQYFAVDPRPATFAGELPYTAKRHVVICPPGAKVEDVVRLRFKRNDDNGRRDEILKLLPPIFHGPTPEAIAAIEAEAGTGSAVPLDGITVDA